MFGEIWNSIRVESAPVASLGSPGAGFKNSRFSQAKTAVFEQAGA